MLCLESENIYLLSKEECKSIPDDERDINAAKNILQVGQMDLYGERITSQAIGEEVEIPMALMKYTGKTERSDVEISVGIGMEQAQRSLVAV